jgi:DNA primase
MIDQSTTNLLQLIPGDFKKVASTGGGEYHGSCPFCGGNDRFTVQPDRNHWWCRKCNQSGDAIAFIREYHNMSFVEACEYLKLDLPKQKSNAPQRKVDLRIAPDIKSNIKYTQWQARAGAFTEYANIQLHKYQHAHVLDYLRKQRKLSDDVLNVFDIGYNPTPVNDTWGGTDVFLPAGIVIPVYDKQGRIHRIKIRTDSGKPKYAQPAGSVPFMFGDTRIRLGDYIILTESEIDAMSIYSYFRFAKGVSAVATGSSTHCRYGRWVGRLALGKKVFVAFDDDDAGMQANTWWMKHLSNGVGIIPSRHDINEMLVAGDDIRNWLQQRLEMTA